MGGFDSGGREGAALRSRSHRSAFYAVYPRAAAAASGRGGLAACQMARRPGGCAGWGHLGGSHGAAAAGRRPLGGGWSVVLAFSCIFCRFSVSTGGWRDALWESTGGWRVALGSLWECGRMPPVCPLEGSGSPIEKLREGDGLPRFPVTHI